MEKFYTCVHNDGFGSQYQKIKETYIYCRKHNLQFAYKPFDTVEHNYDADENYNNKLENLINLKNNIINVERNMNIEVLNYHDSRVIYNFEDNINEYCESEHMDFIKKCFWQNKDRNYFNNNKINVAVQIRRENAHDKGLAGERATTPNNYYLNVMNNIREKYKDIGRQLLFHIYSQGDIDQFQELTNDNDVKFYLNYHIVETFIGMVSADILVISPSSFSYVAALISDGEIYYKNFWHKPRKNWIICDS